MLYPTHKRFGIMFGFGFAIIFLSLGLYSHFTNTHGILLFGSLLISIYGAQFGAEFPDIDKNGTLPTKHHPIIRVFFEVFHAQHRGKFSHSYLTQTLFWLAWIVLSFFIIYLFPKNVIFIALSLFATYIFFRQIAQIIQFVMMFFNSDVVHFQNVGAFFKYLATQDREFARKSHFKPLYGVQIIVSFGASLLISLFFLSSLSQGFNFYTPSNAQILDVRNDLVLYLVFTWAGVMSHLLADMSTYEGVYIGWGERFAPMQIISRFKDVSIIGLFIPDNQFKTGTGWENGARIFISIVDIFLFVVLVFQFFVK